MESGAESWTKCARKLIETSRNARSPVAPPSLVPALSCCLELTFSLDAICRQRGLAIRLRGRPLKESTDWPDMKGCNRVQDVRVLIQTHEQESGWDAEGSDKVLISDELGRESWSLLISDFHPKAFILPRNVRIPDDTAESDVSKPGPNLPALLHIAKLGTVSYSVPYLSVAHILVETWGGDGDHVTATNQSPSHFIFILKHVFLLIWSTFLVATNRLFFKEACPVLLWISRHLPLIVLLLWSINRLRSRLLMITIDYHFKDVEDNSVISERSSLAEGQPSLKATVYYNSVCGMEICLSMWAA